MNVHCNISGLPSIPSLSERPATFDLCNLLALMLSEMKDENVVVKAQRSYAENFNRLDSAAISRKRRQLRHGGWVKRVRKTHRLIPDIYRKGVRLEENQSLDREWEAVSVALYGQHGLFTDFLGSPAWGHQCLSPGAIATLAVLHKTDELVTIAKIANYFSPICSESTIRNGAKKLRKLGIVRDVSGFLVLSEDWSVLLGGYFRENPCCLDRSIKGKKVRTVEREAERIRVTGGALSRSEKQDLLSLPCVRCGGKSSVQEHFPPKRFLVDLPNHNGRFVIWAICQECNDDTRQFIQELPMLKPVNISVQIRDGVDPWSIYRARSNMLLRDWYAAVERNDVPSAIVAAQEALNLYAALTACCISHIDKNVYQTPVTKPRQRIGRKYRGRRQTSASQLPSL